MPIDLVLGVDAINQPLTGIGRYAFELARGLRGNPHVDPVRYFSLGRWIEWSSIVRALEINNANSHAPQSGPRSLRSILADNRLAVQAYARLMPHVTRWRLRREGHALFHSPNYFLPPFPGRSVATVHDLSHMLFPQFHPKARLEYMSRAFPESLRLADHLITPTESVRQEVIEHLGWSPDHITAVAHGVDPVFHPRAASELQALLQTLGLHSHAYTLYVGTIEPRKNIDRLLSAYEALPNELRLQYPLVLAGAHGWNSESVHERIRRAESAGWARYLAFVSQHELPLLYAGARLFAYPSLYEGFGLPVLEAMASGVPVLSSQVSSIAEVVGDAAWLVNPQDADGIASALSQALQDDGWRSNAAAKGLKRASSFTWARCVEQTVAGYQAVMRQEARSTAPF